MLQAIRGQASSWIVKVLFGLLIITFGFWGVDSWLKSAATPTTVAEVGPVRATVITYINPAVAAVLGVAALGERFTPGMGFGFVLVLIGSALATRRSREPVEGVEPQYS